MKYQLPRETIVLFLDVLQKFGQFGYWQFSELPQLLNYIFHSHGGYTYDQSNLFTATYFPELAFFYIWHWSIIIFGLKPMIFAPNEVIKVRHSHEVLVAGLLDTLG